MSYRLFHKNGTLFIMAFALVACLPSLGHASISLSSIGGSASIGSIGGSTSLALTGSGALGALGVLFLLVIGGVVLAGVALTSAGLGSVASVGLGASGVLSSGSLGIGGSLGGAVTSVTSPFVGLSGALGGVSTIPTTGLGRRFSKHALCQHRACGLFSAANVFSWHAGRPSQPGGWAGSGAFDPGRILTRCRQNKGRLNAHGNHDSCASGNPFSNAVRRGKRDARVPARLVG